MTAVGYLGDSVAAALAAHEADATNIHAIANTALLETTAGAQTKANTAQAAATSAAATDATTKANAAQAAAVQRSNHTGTQSADTLTDGTTNKAFLATERTKLAGVATGATANATDPQLRDRTTHTGAQATSTITGLDAALATKVTKGDLFVNVTDAPYSADPLGVVDATAAVQAAATAAKVAGKKLYQPPGSYKISGRVDISTAFVGEGEFVIDTNEATAAIRFARSATAISLTPGSLGGLTVGSTTVTGLAGVRGTLALTSTEHMIERDNGVGQFYTKTDTVKVLDEDGLTVPPLEHAYLTAQLTAWLYPDEAPITVDGLRIRLAGTVLGANPYILAAYRDNVTFNDLSIINGTALEPVSGIDIRSVTGITFNSPKVHGFDMAGAGYGIAIYSSTFVDINDATVTRCRHSLSGRWGKAVKVNGGRFNGAIDSHWVDGMDIENVTVTVGPGDAHIGVCGRNVSARHSKFYGGRSVLAIRDDTPEMAGTLELDDCDWHPSVNATNWLVGYGATSWPYFDFGRTVISPSRVIIRDVRIYNPAAQLLYFLQVAGRAFPHTHWNNVDIDNVHVVTNPGITTAYSADKDSANHPDDTTGPSVRLSRLDFSAVVGDSVYLQNTGDVSDAKGFDLTVADCKGVYLKVPENGMASLVARHSLVYSLLRITASAQPFSGEYLFDDCTLSAMAFNGTFLASFRDCVWSGAATSANLAIAGRVKAYLGNLNAIGATGYPSYANGYNSATYFIPGPREFYGNGSPEGVVVADIGDRYINRTGGPSNTLFVKSASSGLNVGWRACEGEYLVAATMTGVSQSIPYGTAPGWIYTLQADQTFTTVTNSRVGGRLTIMVKQDATGSRLVTWPALMKWDGGVAPTLSTAAGAVDTFQFMCEPAGFWRELSRSLGT